eukprot:5201602-Amphidinium_carterae.1
MENAVIAGKDVYDALTDLGLKPLNRKDKFELHREVEDALTIAVDGETRLGDLQSHPAKHHNKYRDKVSKHRKRSSIFILAAMFRTPKNTPQKIEHQKNRRNKEVKKDTNLYWPLFPF